MSILDIARKQLNADSLSGMADFLGIDSAVLPQLIDESLPALLAIFQRVSADPHKIPLVEQFLTQTDSSILDQPNEALSQYGPELMKGGKSGLARLLGPQLTDYIAPLAQSTGLGEGKIASSLGTLAPFVIGLLGKETTNAEGLQALLLDQSISAPDPEAKIAIKEGASEKSYLPDPNKKKERRPFPKRKAILLVLILALVAALLFWLVETGMIALPNGSEATPEGSLPAPTPSSQSP